MFIFKYRQKVHFMFLTFILSFNFVFNVFFFLSFVFHMFQFILIMSLGPNTVDIITKNVDVVGHVIATCHTSDDHICKKDNFAPSLSLSLSLKMNHK